MFLLGVLALLFVVFGGIYGGGALIWRFVDRLDLDTQRGLLLYFLSILPIMIIAMVAGPFYAVWLGVQGFRKMPWK